LLAALFFGGCAKDRVHTMIVSVPEQKMALYKKGELVKTYDVSTSRFCISSSPNTNGTPLGKMEIAKKIGEGQPSGMKFKSRRPTGEVVRVNAPGRDPIVSRILWLKGLESSNRTTYDRYIYIHGTPQESLIGKPASYGCVRMRSRDIIELFDIVGTGAELDIQNAPLPVPPPAAPTAPNVGPIGPVLASPTPATAPVGTAASAAVSVR
jgi:lipoprotein-anchoring transpeptidase ErfK/SrfK